MYLIYLQMGCYGLGLSRILAASVEVLSTETELRWPEAIVPFSVCIVCPKGGSKEAEAVNEADLQLYDDLLEQLNLVFILSSFVSFRAEIFWFPPWTLLF